jgi:hypothetical protein
MKRRHAILAIDILLVDVVLLILLAFFSGCKASSWYPVMGSVAGGSAGALAGGPVGAGVGAGIGYGGGKTAQLIDQNKDLAQTVNALTHGDVSALVEQGMEKHKSGFEEFTSYIKRILIIAACLLAVYLSIPIFVARKTAETCSKSAAEKHLTKPPFPTNEKS